VKLGGAAGTRRSKTKGFQSFGPVPDEITLEPSELQRAATVDGSGAYFLAVVGGLEEGTETVIRIFAHPLRTLHWKRTSTIRLARVRTAPRSGHPN
jgi:hypothetical protein